MLIRLLAAALAGIIVLPSGWRLSPPVRVVDASTMPQGIALSPDGTLLAVVESGSLPASLRILRTPGLLVEKVIPLRGAFGKPVWLDNDHVLVAGANTDSVLDVEVSTARVSETATGKGTWPAALALDAHGAIATANDGNGTAGIIDRRVPVGEHPSDIVFSSGGGRIYVAVRGSNSVRAFSAGLNVPRFTTIPVGLHPEALALSADGRKLYVAESDDDAIGVIDTRTDRKIADIPVGLNARRANGYGASPNAIAVHGGVLFVSLGAENAIAVVRNDRVVQRIPAGWYPTGVAVGNDGTLYVSNGKGERARPNPLYNWLSHNSPYYVSNWTIGSVRAIPRPAYEKPEASTQAVVANAMPEWTPAPADSTILRPNGPIKHVIYVIKENRSYDQVLGDLPGANGDASFTVLGAAITPNQHALARRFGIFDNGYANSQLSPDGHNWTDAAIANDYVERFWPVIEGDRRDLYDMQVGNAPDVPHSGYLWDAAKRAHVTYRDYGEDLFVPLKGPITFPLNTMPGLTGHYDERFVGWDPAYSDNDRYAEWLREFKQFANGGNLPQLEIVYFPDDHTAGTKPGMRTPFAYVATNDWATGRLVDEVSHSKYWKDTAIFILEDDAQNGPDHVSDQRSTFYLASPYARGGVHHEHYSTVSVVHSIELLLGLPPLSIYDQTARPMYEAFATTAVNASPFASVRPRVDLYARNTKAAYKAAVSARMDFSRPDAADEAALNDIIAHGGRP